MMMMIILPLIIISTLCGQIWPSVAQITIVVEPSPEQQIGQSVYLVGLEGKHFLYNDITFKSKNSCASFVSVELMKMQRTKVAPAADGTVVRSANGTYRIAEHCQFVQVNAQYVRDLADEHVYAIVISLLSRQRKSFNIPMGLFMVDNAIITLNFENEIPKTQIFWKNTDLVNSNIKTGQDRHHQIKAYLTEKYRKLKQERNEKVALTLKSAINDEVKMKVKEEKEEGKI